MEWRKYEEKLLEIGYDSTAIGIVKPAFEFAGKVHAAEKRESNEPYIIHPIEVSLSIAELHLDAETVAAALLHDVVENQSTNIEKLKKNFSEEVVFLVDAVTKVDKIKYRGAERAVESLRKMFLALAEDIRVVLIKLMDRLHNMKTLQFLRPEKQKRIALETLELYAPLADRLGMWELKAELEDLAFPYVYPEEYEWTKEQVEGRRKEGRRHLDMLTPMLEKELKKESVKIVRISHRIKNLFSIWHKAVKYEMDLDRVLDIVAERIVVIDLEDCYQTLGTIHKLWRPVPGKIKDYIALPKPNGYQGLHTAVFGPNKKIVELQIRTEAMDEEAKYGIAAHWAYKIKGTKEAIKKSDDKKLRWVRQLQEWQKDHESSPDDTLSALKIDFFKDRIFVLTPKGDVVDLPEHSTPIDFAYHIHSEIGDHMFGAKVKGKMVPFSYQLQSGETVEIMTQRGKKPTPDWLDHARTSLAKNRIRSHLRKEGALEPTKGKKNKNIFEADITARDRVGLLKDISAVLSNLGINILDVKVDYKNKNYPRMILVFLQKRGLSTAKILTNVKKK